MYINLHYLSVCTIFNFASLVLDRLHLGKTKKICFSLGLHYLCTRFARLERCRSGRSGRSRKPLYPRGYPGFESLSFRKDEKDAARHRTKMKSPAANLFVSGWFCFRGYPAGIFHLCKDARGKGGVSRSECNERRNSSKADRGLFLRKDRASATERRPSAAGRWRHPGKGDNSCSHLTSPHLLHTCRHSNKHRKRETVQGLSFSV